HTKAYPLPSKKQCVKEAIYVFEDISISKNAEEKVRYSEQKYRTTINSMRDGIHVVDDNLTILLANKALVDWNKRLGLTCQVVGKNLKKVYPFLGDLVEGEYKRVFESGRIMITEEQNKVKDRVFTTETRKIPVREGDRTIRVVTVIRDITQRKNAEKSLIKYAKSLSEANRKLEALNENKAQFISIASHELKTPITIIKGYADALDMEGLGELTAKQKKVAGKISKKTMHLAEMVDLMLDLSRIELGQFRLQKKTVNLSRLTQELFEDFRYRAQEKEIEFSKRIHKNIRKKIDDARIKQVYTNLLDNAFKYTPRGGKVKLSLTKKGDYAVFRVCDTGIGIPQEHFEEVFKPFSCVDGSRTRKQGGVGLGLAIVKQITELHGGQVFVKKRSKGTCFEVQLP
ncbi:MAG: PAS domain S-box protein, partial [Candidatus Altiarchaeales archaeon]|nr:PAS domain S-box protein [Candidatus Altiarchaeales archaeon]